MTDLEKDEQFYRDTESIAFPKLDDRQMGMLELQHAHLAVIQFRKRDALGIAVKLFILFKVGHRLQRFKTVCNMACVAGNVQPFTYPQDRSAEERSFSLRTFPEANSFPSMKLSVKSDYASRAVLSLLTESFIEGKLLASGNV